MYSKAHCTICMFVLSAVDVISGEAELMLHACFCNEGIFFVKCDCILS
jgi:hypothetical protein